MTRFEAIEARASQYPASTNDVVWLVNRLRQIRNLSDELWEIRLALSFGTSDPNAALKIREALRRLDTIRARLTITELDVA